MREELLQNEVIPLDLVPRFSPSNSAITQGKADPDFVWLSTARQAARRE